MKRTEKIFKALANQKRLEIIQLLRKKGGFSMLEIAERINLSFRSTSKHLSQLLGAEIILRDRQGRFTEYRLSPDAPKLFKATLPLLK